MNLILIYQLLLLLVTCIYFTYTDIKCGKISNKAIIVFGFLILFGDLVSFWNSDKTLFSSFLINCLISAFVGVLLYSLGVWAGGDCKLFFLVSIGFPAQLYYNFNGNNISLWMILFAAFCVGTIYIIVDSFVICLSKKASLNWKKILLSLKRSIKNYLINLVYIYAFGQVFFIIVHNNSKYINEVFLFSSFAFLIVINKIKLLKTRFSIISVILFNFAITIIIRKFPMSIELINYVVLLLMFAVRAILENFNYETINTSDVKAGMVISRMDTLIFMKSKIQGLPKLSDETLKSRINESEAQSIRKWEHSKYGSETITVVRKMPFAVFILIGVLVYLALGLI